eukprot:g3795.t1
MFEIRDRYVAARKRNPELNRAMAAIGQIAPASIERGVDRILEVMRALQLPTGELELKPMMERMSDAVVDTDAGSLKLSDLQDILRSLARKHDVLDRPVWEVVSDVVEQFDGLTFEESITKWFVLLTVIARACVGSDEAQESPWMDSLAKLPIDPSLLTWVRSLGRMKVSAVINLYEELRHVFNTRLDLVNLYYVTRRTRELVEHLTSKTGGKDAAPLTLRGVLQKAGRLVITAAKQTDPADKTAGGWAQNMMRTALKSASEKEDKEKEEAAKQEENKANAAKKKKKRRRKKSRRTGRKDEL